MRAPNSATYFVTGVAFLGLTLVGVLVGPAWCTLAAAVQGVLYMRWAYTAEPDERLDGPDPLRATPAKRFRATGWPPAKDPDEYR